tara:strand:+ start:427 stop:1464 length:1038 start_codon:yes stop_codon:yes gene_type:complete
MSNFTDFFTTGFPVNSYAPFFITGTNNPPGYNANGLYNHPNGDVWMETGKTLTTTAALYPDATGVTSFTSSITQINSVGSGLPTNGASSPISLGKTSILSVDEGVNNLIYYYTSTNLTSLGTLNSSSASLTDTLKAVQNPAFNRSTDEHYVVGNNTSGGGIGNVIHKISESTFTETGTIGPVAQCTGGIKGIAFDHTNGFYYLYDATSEIIYQYITATNVYTGRNVNMSSAVGDMQGMTFDGTYLIVTDRNHPSSSPQRMNFITTNNGTVFNQGSIKGYMTTSGIDWRGIAYDSNNNNRFYFSQYNRTWSNANDPIYSSALVVGNPTLQYGGSSASNIPMFVKIK